MKGEDAMETDGRLDDRKVKILKAVIQNYLDTENRLAQERFLS